MSDHEKRHQPGWGKMIGTALVGSLVGLAVIGGIAGQLDLPGPLFMGLGALFGAGIGLSVSVVLGQALHNSSL